MDLDRALAERGTLILDGGLSTQLELGGADLENTLWSASVLLDNPGAVLAAHRAFVGAGADVLITASYQVSFEGFAARGLDAATAEAALRASVRIAREAAAEAGREVLVAASVGPYGAILADGSEYRGHYGLTHAELASFHRRRMEVLLDARPDLLAIEFELAQVRAHTRIPRPPDEILKEHECRKLKLQLRLHERSG